MELNDLTQLMYKFVHAKGWYSSESPKPQTLKNLAISLTLEAGEVLEHFQWSDEIIDADEFASELADVALYLMQIASIAEVNLESAILKKLEQNSNRVWE